MFLDFKKPFDTVSHEFLNNVSSKFKFGESFKNWVKSMYKNTESCVKTTGGYLNPFRIIEE